MKVRYEFEINKQEYHKVLCEGCQMLNFAESYIFCALSQEVSFRQGVFAETEEYYINMLSNLESKCPVEVVE